MQNEALKHVTGDYVWLIDSDEVYKKNDLEKIKENRILFDFAKGGLICNRCASGKVRKASLSKGTIKQLRWIETGQLEKAKRIRFAGRELKEALEVMERFVPYHLGKKPKSLVFLGQIRNEGKL